MPRKVAVPKYCLHKSSGHARTKVHGKWIALGKYGTPESKERYRRAIAEMDLPPTLPVDNADGLTVVELLASYLAHAKQYYPKTSGEPTRFLEAIRELRALYGTTQAALFGPRELKLVREAMIEADLCRTLINKRIGWIKRAYRWAVSEGLLSVLVYQALATVPGLRRGYCKARESSPVRPVPEADLATVLPYMSPTVRAMVELQRLTGCRPGELAILRPGDVDRSGETWCYVPAHHKTELKGKTRQIYIGPRGQDVLRPFLLRAADAFCFSPAESMAWWNEKRAEERTTPLGYGNRPGTNRKARPAKKPGDRYVTASYRRAIATACRAAHVTPFSPHRLRHSAASEVCAKFGIEATRTVLGHASISTSELYAERDGELARKVASAIG